MAYPFNTSGVLLRLKALVESDSAISGCRIGFPAAWPDRFSAYIGTGGQSIDDEIDHGLRRELRFLVMTGYRIVPGADAAIETAELAIVDALDRLLLAIYGDPQLNDLLAKLHADSTISDTAEYQMYASQEVRLYGLSVRGEQWGQY